MGDAGTQHDAFIDELRAASGRGRLTQERNS
jgi:hypothetical protein